MNFHFCFGRIMSMIIKQWWEMINQKLTSALPEKELRTWCAPCHTSSRRGSGISVSWQGERLRTLISPHICAVGSAKQANDCSVVTAFIVTHIQKTFEHGDDAGDSLESKSETVFTAPTLQPVDSSPTGDPKTLQEKQNEILCRAEVTTCVTHKDKCQANKGKAFASIHSQCNKAMQHKLRSRTNCKRTVKWDLIKHSDAISEHSMSHMENKHHASIVVDGIKNFVNLRQKWDESLVNCTCLLKAATKVMESRIGGCWSNVLNGWVTGGRPRDKSLWPWLKKNKWPSSSKNHLFAQGINRHHTGSLAIENTLFASTN